MKKIETLLVPFEDGHFLDACAELRATLAELKPLRLVKTDRPLAGCEVVALPDHIRWIRQYRITHDDFLNALQVDIELNVDVQVGGA